MSTKTAERKEFLADIIVGAVEGGTNYWAMAAGYKHADPETTSVTLIEDEYGDLFNDSCLAFAETHGRKPKLSELTDLEGVHTITPDKIATALGKIQRGEVKMNSGLLATIKLANKENDAGDIDADAADVIVQVACFGSVVYG